MNKLCATMNCRNVLVAALSNLSGCLMCLTFLFILATPGVAEFRALEVHSPNLLLGMPNFLCCHTLKKSGTSALPRKNGGGDIGGRLVGDSVIGTR